MQTHERSSVTAFWVQYLTAVGLLHICLSQQLVYGHVWPSDDSEYLSDHESFDHSKDLSIRHLLSSYWPKEPHNTKIAERLALAESDGSESHVTSHIEEYHPVYVHTTKPFTRSMDSHLMASTVPALILTVLTFPLTLTLLFFIVKQLVNIQTVFNQNLVNQMGSEGHSRVSSDQINNAESNLDKALNKFKSEN